MKNLTLLLLTLFLVRVKMPLGVEVTYHHVSAVNIYNYGTSWELVLEDGRKAYVPVFWAVVEEEKFGDDK